MPSNDNFMSKVDRCGGSCRQLGGGREERVHPREFLRSPRTPALWRLGAELEFSVHRTSLQCLAVSPSTEPKRHV